MSKLIGKLVVSAEFLTTEEGNRIFWKKVRNTTLYLENKYNCKVIDGPASKDLDGNLVKNFYVDEDNNE